MDRMREWFIDHSWDQVYSAESAHQKAAIFQKILINKMDEIFPEKIRKVHSDDQPWISHKLKQMDRKRKRIFHKERRSERWKSMNKVFKKELKSAKSDSTKIQFLNLKLRSLASGMQA